MQDACHKAWRVERWVVGHQRILKLFHQIGDHPCRQRLTIKLLGLRQLRADERTQLVDFRNVLGGAVNRYLAVVGRRRLARGEGDFGQAPCLRLALEDVEDLLTGTVAVLNRLALTSPLHGRLVLHLENDAVALSLIRVHIAQNNVQVAKEVFAARLIRFIIVHLHHLRWRWLAHL